jgi:hypothetical protein
MYLPISVNLKIYCEWKCVRIYTQTVKSPNLFIIHSNFILVYDLSTVPCYKSQYTATVTILLSGRTSEHGRQCGRQVV